MMMSQYSASQNKGGWSPDNVPPEKYAADRVWQRIFSFRKKRKNNRSKYHAIQITIIITSAVITVGNALGGGSIWVSAASSILGALIIILIGISELKKYQENWILFGTNEEALRRQYYLWKNEAGEYSDIPSEHERRKLLVEKVEAILLSQYSAFFGIHKEKPAAPVGASVAAPTPVDAPTPASETTETPALAGNIAKAPVQKSPATETDPKPETRTHKPATKRKKRESIKRTKRKSSSKKTKKKTSRRKRK